MYRIFLLPLLFLFLGGCADHADTADGDDSADDDDSADGANDDSAGDDDSSAGDDDDSAANINSDDDDSAAGASDDDDSAAPTPPPCAPQEIPTLAGTCVSDPFAGAHHWRITVTAAVPDMVMGSIPWDDPVDGDPWAFLPDPFAIVYVGNDEVTRTDTAVDTTTVTATWEGPVAPMGFSVSVYEHDPGFDSIIAGWSWAGPSTVRTLLEAGGADEVEYTGSPVGVSVVWVEVLLVD